MVYKAFQDLSPCCNFPMPISFSFSVTFLLTPSAAAMLLAPLTVLQSTNHMLTSGPLHLLSLLPGMLFPETKSHSCISFRYLLTGTSLINY